jgi:hypothetical protein
VIHLVLRSRSNCNALESASTFVFTEWIRICTGIELNRTKPAMDAHLRMKITENKLVAAINAKARTQRGLLDFSQARELSNHTDTTRQLRLSMVTPVLLPIPAATIRSQQSSFRPRARQSSSMAAAA